MPRTLLDEQLDLAMADYRAASPEAIENNLEGLRRFDPALARLVARRMRWIALRSALRTAAAWAAWLRPGRR